MKFTMISTLFFAASASAAVPSLTPENYSSLTDGKTVFIKFFAPWCGHCKKMAPDWEKLADEWADKSDVLIAEIDCTAEGKPICDEAGIKGFPTLKFGDPLSLEDYQGGRTYSDFSTFANANLKPMCSPSKLELCDDEKKAEIEKLIAMPDGELEAIIATEEEKLEEAEKFFKEEVQKLQSRYNDLVAEKDAKDDAVKNSGLGLMKSVKAQKAKAGSDEL